MKNIYIVPIDHQMQSFRFEEYPHQTVERFIRFLKEIINEKNIEVVADEWSDLITSQNNQRPSNIEGISNELDVLYIKMELNKEDYTINKIPKNNSSHWLRYFYKRHCFWLMKIKENLDKNILIVCGSNHVSSSSKYQKKVAWFDEFLKKRGYGNIIVLNENFYY